jgi:hypothetical protein
LYSPEGSTTGHTTGFADGISRLAVAASDAAHALGKLEGSTSCLSGALDNLPDLFSQINALNILRQIVQAAHQVPGIQQGSQGSLPQTGDNSKPILFAHLHRNPILVWNYRYA